MFSHAKESPTIGKILHEICENEYNRKKKKPFLCTVSHSQIQSINHSIVLFKSEHMKKVSVTKVKRVIPSPLKQSRIGQVQIKNESPGIPAESSEKNSASSRSPLKVCA